MTILLLILAMIFNLLAQSVLKQGVSNINPESFQISTGVKLFTSPLILSGALIYGLSFIFYILAISRGELSRISPASQALTTLGIVIISVLIFKEPLTLYKVLGVSLLMVGTFIIFIR